MPESGAEDDDDDSDDSDSDAGTSNRSKKKSKDSATGVYVPPKLSAVHYDGDDSKNERARKQMERARKRALKWVSE